MNIEPCDTVSGKQYYLFLQFEGDEPVSSPDGPFDDQGVIEARYQLVELLLENQPMGIVTLHDNVNVITARDKNLLPVTARVWVSEAGR